MCACLANIQSVGVFIPGVGDKLYGLVDVGQRVPYLLLGGLVHGVDFGKLSQTVSIF